MPWKRTSFAIAYLKRVGLAIGFLPLTKKLPQLPPFIRWQGPREGVAHRCIDYCSTGTLKASHGSSRGAVVRDRWRIELVALQAESAAKPKER